MTAPIDHYALSKRPFNAGQALALGFLTLIIVGGLTLALPVSASAGRSLGLIKGLFTATSAVCVTGLSIIDAGKDLSLFGQIVLLLLIQIGGLGFMVFATLGMVLLGRRVSLRNRMLISESMNQSGLSGMVKLTMLFSSMAIITELIGAAILATRFVPAYGTATGIWFGLFHSISAFCNAGFDLFGNNRSLLDFSQDVTVLLTLASLIIIGGLGFAVLLEILQHRRTMRRLSLHAKLVLTVTGLLLASGTLLILMLEFDNPQTLGMAKYSFGDKLVNSFFQAVTMRTAGFAAIDQGLMTDTSKLMGCLYMFIGASPASTGGGIKTTTFATLILLVFSVIRGHDRITVFDKEIASETVKRAVSLIAIAVTFIAVVTCAISILERDSGIPMLDLAFETTSAITTTGLSAAGTTNLRISSQVLLMPLMYLGRVGPLSLAMALAYRMRKNSTNRIHHPEEKIMIG